MEKALIIFALLGLLSPALSDDVCNIHCDNLPISDATGPFHEAAFNFSNGRFLILYVSNTDNMAYAYLTGLPGEEVWLERSFNGGKDNDSSERTGNTQIPPGSNEASTNLWNVDNPNELRIGALRACTILPNDLNSTCTEWARSDINAADPLDAAITSMMMFYEPWRGLWKTVGWWNAANDMTVLIDYHLLTGRDLYKYSINNTFELNKDENQFGGWNFTFGSIDDNLWWGLCWIRAYDLTKEQKYLDMAVFIADYCYDYHDDICGGGVWWSDEKTYKNAVTNEQYIKLAVQLHNRIEGDTKYLEQAKALWTWLRNVGMINEENLINDGLRECRNNGEETWTYNQGIILGALAELFIATGDNNYLEEAKKIADAVIASTHINDENGVLWEPCWFDVEPDCGPNAPCFKGIFMRNLGELNRIVREQRYTAYIRRNAESNLRFNRNALNQYGLKWSGPLDGWLDASRQQSVIDVLLADYMERKN